VSYNAINVNSQNNKAFKSNFSPKKDIFKMNFPYDVAFWSSQNQLLLNQEQQNFINNINSFSREFNIYSNFK
jgi:hypothetical protein